MNDLLIIESKNFMQIVHLRNALNKRFKMTNLNSCYHYFDMKIIKNRNNRTLSLSQSFYVKKILNRFEMINCKFAFIFMNIDIKFEFNKNLIIVDDVKLFQIMMNNLMYATYIIRLNICFNVQCLSRMNMNSFKKTFVVVKKIFRYLQKNIDVKIIYDCDIEFEKFIDAN